MTLLDDNLDQRLDILFICKKNISKKYGEFKI